eukprot:TRINITY_DN1104_c0_g1_i5.p4 TRINITY_DN1104_c0_g1~~TRINITY_DN1104_c0_g1_i5.p4  ORF type:complete len:231 (+),score=34.44 TRINITY_DN1104_c0_g1_i5:34-726(+)
MVHHFLLQILRVLKPFLTKRTRERYQRGQFTIIRLLLATNTKITLLINNGKSTLLQVIAGLQQETDGSIYLGHNPEPCNPLDRNKKVGLVFQFPERHFVGSSILQEMCFGWPRLPEYQKDRDVLFSRLKEVLHQVGLDTVNVYSSPLSLSGGYKRRLAMALQLVRRPSVLLLDEPLAGLDWKARKDVHSLLQSISNKCTILIVSHDLKELMPYCDQLWRMKEGGILVEEG